MQRINKKAVSQVVTAVLLILIAVVAVTAIGAVIIKLTSNSQLSPETSCSIIQIKKPVEISKACYNQNTQEIEAILKRTSENIVVGSIDFIANSQTQSSTWTCDSSCIECNILKQEQTKKYYLISEKPATLTINVNNCKVETVDIKDC